MSGGFLKGVQVPGVTYTLTTAVSYAGTLVKMTTTADTVDTCGAGEKPMGYTQGTTVSPITGSAVAGVKGSVLPLINGNVIEVPLLATNVEIAVGDELETTAAGTVDKKSSAGEIVGYAAEAKAATAGAGAFIKVIVYQRTAAS